MSIKLIIVRMVVIKKLIKLKLKLIISFKISNISMESIHDKNVDQPDYYNFG